MMTLKKHKNMVRNISLNSSMKNIKMITDGMTLKITGKFNTVKFSK